MNGASGGLEVLDSVVAGPVAAAVGLPAERAAEALRRVRPRDPLGRTAPPRW
jgi:hypothetical protein